MKDYILHFGQYFINNIVSIIPSHFIRLFVYSLAYRIGKRTSILLHVNFLGRRIKIGDNTVINQYCIIDGRGIELEIGNNVDIGPHTHIWTLSHDTKSSDHTVIKEKTKIEENCWIASTVTILPGIQVKKGAVIAAGSVVTKDVEEYTIVAGNPAKPIGKRNSKLTYKNNYQPPFM